MSNPSTGPRTPDGKARSSQNASKHGILSDRDVTPDEDAAEWQQFRDDVVAEWHPATTQERELAGASPNSTGGCGAWTASRRIPSPTPRTWPAGTWPTRSPASTPPTTARPGSAFQAAQDYAEELALVPRAREVLGLLHNAANDTPIDPGAGRLLRSLFGADVEPQPVTAGQLRHELAALTRKSLARRCGWRPRGWRSGGRNWRRTRPGRRGTSSSRLRRRPGRDGAAQRARRAPGRSAGAGAALRGARRPHAGEGGGPVGEGPGGPAGAERRPSATRTKRPSRWPCWRSCSNTAPRRRRRRTVRSAIPLPDPGARALRWKTSLTRRARKRRRTVRSVIRPRSSRPRRTRRRSFGASRPENTTATVRCATREPRHEPVARISAKRRGIAASALPLEEPAH